MTIAEHRKQSARLRISPRRRQFLVDVIMHDLELVNAGISAEERSQSLKRFIATFDGQGCSNNDKH